jgi:hypothetical protein
MPNAIIVVQRHYKSLKKYPLTMGRFHTAAGSDQIGSAYRRKILVHGARAVVLRSKRDRIVIGDWMTALDARAPRNVLIAATANKLARTTWGVLSSGQDNCAAEDQVLWQPAITASAVTPTSAYSRPRISGPRTEPEFGLRDLTFPITDRATASTSAVTVMLNACK